MSRFIQLQEMINDVRLDLGDNMEVAKGRFTDAHIQRALNRVQNILWATYEWPFRFRYWAMPLVAGQRLYDLPDEVEFDGVTNMYVEWNGGYLPLNYGFSQLVNNAYDHNQDERTDPVIAYRLHEPPFGKSRPQIEVWPTPTRDGIISDDPNMLTYLLPKDIEDDGLKLNGHDFLLIHAGRRVPKMLRQQDVCYLDSELLIAFSVAEISVRRELPDAQLKMDYARDLLVRIRANSTNQDSITLTRDSRPAKYSSSYRFFNKYGPRIENP